VDLDPKIPKSRFFVMSLKYVWNNVAVTISLDII